MPVILWTAFYPRHAVLEFLEQGIDLLFKAADVQIELGQKIKFHFKICAHVFLAHTHDIPGDILDDLAPLARDPGQAEGVPVHVDPAFQGFRRMEALLETFRKKCPDMEYRVKGHKSLRNNGFFS